MVTDTYFQSEGVVHSGEGISRNWLHPQLISCTSSFCVAICAINSSKVWTVIQVGEKSSIRLTRMLGVRAFIQSSYGKFKRFWIHLCQHLICSWHIRWLLKSSAPCTVMDGSTFGHGCADEHPKISANKSLYRKYTVLIYNFWSFLVYLLLIFSSRLRWDLELANSSYDG
jgi:hypothetical protein